MGEALETLQKFNSFEEFLEFEQHSEIRYEFYDGEVFAMAGTTIIHNLIVSNTSDIFKEHFRPRGCFILTESVKLEAIKNFYYPYPDVMLTCNENDKKEPYIIKNPSIIIEVLSKSTEETDRKFKWQRYKRIPSLQHFILVSQYEILVEVFSRIENSETWLYQSFDELTQEIELRNMDFKIPVSRIYENIAFPPINEMQQ
ncbi:MAG: Uma2 family endonuclease [Verrucomicrobia bacterium]|nr:Uma2 family endonuclease [Cytophagales bacterium]